MTGPRGEVLLDLGQSQKDRTRRRLVLLTFEFLCLAAVACVGLVARSLGLCEFVSDGALLFFSMECLFSLERSRPILGFGIGHCTT